MGLLNSILLKLKKQKVIHSKHPGCLLEYKDFALKTSSLTIVGPLCKKDIDKLVEIAKGFGELTHLDLRDATEILEISDNQFHGCDSLENIILPEELKRVGESAFEYCRNLSTVVFPSELQTISKSAFYGCCSLQEVNIPKNVKSIGNWAFVCNDLRNIVVDEQNNQFKAVEDVLYTKNGETLIKYPSQKEGDSYIIPNTVTKIANGAFQDCNELAHITLPQNLKEIGDNAFLNTSIQEIDLPNGMISVGKMAFSQCKFLERATIPGTITYLGDRAFTECHKLNSVDFGDGITGIGDNIFANCHCLTKIDLPESAYIVKN